MMTKTALFVTLVSFWTLILIFSNIFAVDLSLTKSVYDTDTNTFQSFLSGIPVINLFLPLFNIMFFQLTDKIPVWMSLIFNMIAILSAYLVYDLIKR